MDYTRSAKEEYINIRTCIEDVWGKEEASSITSLLLAHYYNLNRTDILTGKEFLLCDSIGQQLEAAVKRLRNMEPIQYILGESEFCGLRLIVNEYVLIPRPETEELVHLIVSENKIAQPVIMDIGTGSGCIPVALGSYIPNATLYGIDVNEDALKVALANAKRNNIRLATYHTDIIEEAIPGINYDIVISNPPYIRVCEKEYMRKNVLDYEPESALFVPDDDPLIFYRVIADKAHDKLKAKGRLYFEINESFGIEIGNILSQSGYKDINVYKDIHGKPRMISATN